MQLDIIAFWIEQKIRKLFNVVLVNCLKGVFCSTLVASSWAYVVNDSVACKPRYCSFKSHQRLIFNFYKFLDFLTCNWIIVKINMHVVKYCFPLFWIKCQLVFIQCTCISKWTRIEYMYRIKYGDMYKCCCFRLTIAFLLSNSAFLPQNLKNMKC